MTYIYTDEIMGFRSEIRRQMIVVTDTDSGVKHFAYCPKYTERQLIKYCRAYTQSLAKEKEND